MAHLKNEWSNKWSKIGLHCIAFRKWAQSVQMPFRALEETVSKIFTNSNSALD